VCREFCTPFFYTYAFSQLAILILHPINKKNEYAIEKDLLPPNPCSTKLSRAEFAKVEFIHYFYKNIGG
jgi:hypothetical protein